MPSWPEAAVRGKERRPFTTERVGGEAVAKNVPTGWL